MDFRPNFLNPKRFTHQNTRTYKKGDDKMECIRVVKALPKATSGIGAKGDVDRRYIESTRTKTHVLHATKGWRKI